MNDLILPEMTAQLTSEMLDACVLQSNIDTKIKLDMNYLILLRQQHAEVPASQFLNYLYKCKLYNADPRMQQVFLVSYKAKKKKNVNGQWLDVWETTANVVFAYQFFMERAESTGQRSGHEVDTVEGEYFNPFTRERFPDLLCKAKVFRKDRMPIVYTARMREFVSLTKEGQPRGQWLEKPYLMLEKCALANAYRWAFPEWMTGMYTQEEISSDPITIDVEPVMAPKRGPGRPPLQKEIEVASISLEKAVEEFVAIKPETPAVIAPLQKVEPAPLIIKPTPAPTLTLAPEPKDVKPAKPPMAKPPVRDPEKMPISIVTKGRLWSLVKASGDVKKINIDFVQQKLATMGTGLTEAVGRAMCDDLVNGYLNWFLPEPAPTAPAPSVNDEPEDVPF
jgi:phage recombination protein Bet